MNALVKDSRFLYPEVPVLIKYLSVDLNTLCFISSHDLQGICEIIKSNASTRRTLWGVARVFVYLTDTATPAVNLRPCHMRHVTCCLRLSSATCSTDSTVAFAQNFAQNSQETSCTIAATPQSTPPPLLPSCCTYVSSWATVGLGQSSWQPKKGQKMYGIYFWLAAVAAVIFCAFLSLLFSLFIRFFSYLQH